MVDALLFIFQFSGFAGGQLAAFDALGNAVLLIFAALADGIVAVMRGVGVVLVSVNLLGKLILLFIDGGFFRRGQFAAVGCAVGAGFTVYGRFLGFQVGGFTGSQLSALHALTAAALFIFLALSDFVRVLGVRRSH